MLLGSIGLMLGLALVGVVLAARKVMVAPERSSSGTPATAEGPPPAVATHVDAAVVIAAAPVDASVPRSPEPAADAAVMLDGSASVLPPKPPPPPTAAPALPAVQASGKLVVLAKPWATLFLDGKPVGETPYRVSIPAGRHTLRIVNEERGKDEWVTVTIVAGQTTTIERKW